MTRLDPQYWKVFNQGASSTEVLRLKTVVFCTTSSFLQTLLSLKKIKTELIYSGTVDQSVKCGAPQQEVIGSIPVSALSLGGNTYKSTDVDLATHERSHLIGEDGA